MGKRRTVKKVEVNNQEPSSSSSKNNRKRTLDKTDNGQKEKKLKKETKTKVLKSSINDLPPEMVMKVLKNVDSKSLVGCRLVNRKWNGIASEILQSRSDVELKFDYSDDHGTAYFLFQDKKRSLFDLIECYKSSKNFPFAHFYFSHVDGSSFDQCDWIEFISDFKENIKGLKLSIKSRIPKDEDFIKVIEKVRDLLLSKLPELEKFGLSLAYRSATTNPSANQLFPTSTESSKSKKTIQLPHIKVLYLDDFTFMTHIGIATDLLSASVNLQKLEPVYKDGKYTNLRIFDLLQSVGKFSCLQAAKIDPVEILLQLKPSAPLQFKLRSLDLIGENLYNYLELWSDGTVFLSQLFESSKDTLRELNMPFLGFLDDLQLPKFSQLTSLSTRGEEFRYWEGENSEAFFPSQVNPMEIFPALRSLELGLPWSKAFPNENTIPCFPTLETLKVAGNGMNENCIAQISLMCPNLKDFEILRDDDSFENFLKVGRAIWTHLKKLQSLKIYVDADNPGGGFPAFDSCITGFSKKDCRRLYKLLLADKLLKESGSEAKIPQSEMEPERKFPSILDLKDLKFFQLDVLCYYWDKSLDIKPNLTKKGPTRVSEKCALDLMDKLVYDIDKQVYYYD